jgi:hypothetical protein
VWVLDRIAPDVVEHFALHFAGDASPTVPQFLQRLRADLSATSDIVSVQPSGTADAAWSLGEAVPPAAPADEPRRH